MQDYLIEQEKYFGCRLSYFGNDKKRFQLEVPESHARKANSKYSLEGQKKGNKPARRYTTEETKVRLRKANSGHKKYHKIKILILNM